MFFLILFSSGRTGSEDERSVPYSECSRSSRSSSGFRSTSGESRRSMLRTKFVK